MTPIGAADELLSAIFKKVLANFKVWAPQRSSLLFGGKNVFLSLQG